MNANPRNAYYNFAKSYILCFMNNTNTIQFIIFHNNTNVLEFITVDKQMHMA